MRSSHAAKARPYSVHNESSGELPEAISIGLVWRGGNVLSSGVEAVQARLKLCQNRPTPATATTSQISWRGSLRMSNGFELGRFGDSGHELRDLAAPRTGAGCQAAIGELVSATAEMKKAFAETISAMAGLEKAITETILAMAGTKVAMAGTKVAITETILAMAELKVAIAGTTSAIAEMISEDGFSAKKSRKSGLSL